jgi:hypothetical protein
MLLPGARLAEPLAHHPFQKPLALDYAHAYPVPGLSLVHEP